MSGLSDYASKNLLNYLSGQIAEPTLPAVYLALFTAAPSDAGTGGTEVTGGSYARVQVAGTATTSAATTTASPTLTFTSTPAWITAGMTVYDTTTAKNIGTVQSTTGTTVTLTANAANAVGNGDVLSFSAFGNATGSAPSSITNTASITFATPTASWGDVLAFGLYDASTSGNLLAWDYLGNFSWLPCTVSSASPGVLTAHAHGYSANDSVIFSTEYGGTAPTFSASNFTGTLTVQSPATDTFTVKNGATAVNTSSTGSGMVRKITVQTISTSVVASFAASALTLTQA